VDFTQGPFLLQFKLLYKYAMIISNRLRSRYSSNGYLACADELLGPGVGSYMSEQIALSVCTLPGIDRQSPTLFGFGRTIAGSKKRNTHSILLDS